MTLTVRLDAALESALQHYCEQHGLTKSLVVQECLGNYLLAHQTRVDGARAGLAPSVPPHVSANYRAFAEAGFIGAGELGGGSADKAAVRARAMQRIRRASK